jgi:uncharacterized protein (TIGR02466 family)
MNEPILHGIFPTPILIVNIGREFTDDEKSFFDLQKETIVNNLGNITSADNYLMKNKVMADINNELLFALNHYMDKIIVPKDDVKPYITQSWLNWTEKGQFHHRHAHQNSYLSGVLYINTDEEKDKIIFFNDGYEKIHVYSKEWNLFNSKSWFFNVKPGDIIVFPSHLQHMVEPTTSDETRVSLSFNTFLRGKIGDEHQLTELLNL